MTNRCLLVAFVILSACSNEKKDEAPPPPKKVEADKPPPPAPPPPVAPPAPVAPFDIAAGKAALAAQPWEGTLNDRPAKLVFTLGKDGALKGKLTEGKANVIALDADIAPTGKITMKAVPRPSPQGLITQSYAGKFSDDTLAKISGIYEEAVKQGFVEQSGEYPWVFVKAEAKPAKGAKKKH